MRLFLTSTKYPNKHIRTTIPKPTRTTIPKHLYTTRVIFLYLPSSYEYLLRVYKNQQSFSDIIASLCSSHSHHVFAQEFIPVTYKDKVTGRVLQSRHQTRCGITMIWLRPCWTVMHSVYHPCQTQSFSNCFLFIPYNRRSRLNSHINAGVPNVRLGWLR